MTVKILQTGIKALSNATNRLAVKDKAFAQELVFLHGIKGKITPKALKESGITKDMFGATGKLTESGKKEVTRMIKGLGLKDNATWDDIYASLKASKEAIKIEPLKLNKLA